jgi:CBS domain-containing protein
MPDERLEGHGPKHRRVGRDTPVVKAIRLMLDNNVGGLPLADDGKVVGILTEGDLFALAARPEPSGAGRARSPDGTGRTAGE